MNLPQEVEYLRLDFWRCKTLNDNGFQGISKTLAISKGLRKVTISTASTNVEKLTGDHIDMVSNILPQLKKLEEFWFSHENFPNTKKMEEILINELSMKPTKDNDDQYTSYKKE